MHVNISFTFHCALSELWGSPEGTLQLIVLQEETVVLFVLVFGSTLSEQSLHLLLCEEEVLQVSSDHVGQDFHLRSQDVCQTPARTEVCVCMVGGGGGCVRSEQLNLPLGVANSLTK